MEEVVTQPLDERHLRVRDDLALAPLELIHSLTRAAAHDPTRVLDERARTGNVVVKRAHHRSLKPRPGHRSPYVLEELDRELHVARGALEQAEQRVAVGDQHRIDRSREPIAKLLFDEPRMLNDALLGRLKCGGVLLI